MKNSSISNTVFSLLFLTLCIISSNAWPQSEPDTDKNETGFKTLPEDASNASKESTELDEWRQLMPSRIAELASRPITQAEVERSRLDVESLKAKIKSITLDISTVEQQHEDLILAIKNLESKLQVSPASPEDQNNELANSQFRESLTENKKLLQLEAKNLGVLNNRKQSFVEYLNLKEQWLSELYKAYQNQQERLREQNLGELETQLNKERILWQKKAEKYSSQLKQYRQDPASSIPKQEYFKALFLETEDSIFLIDARLKTAKMQAKLETQTIGNNKIVPDINQLKDSLEEMKRLEIQAASLIELLTIKDHLLKQRIEVVSKQLSLNTTRNKELQLTQAIYQRLNVRVIKQLELLTIIHKKLKEHINTIDDQYLQQKRSSLRTRHLLPLSLKEWQVLIKEISNLPGKTLHLTQEALIKLWKALLAMNSEKGFVLILSGLLWSFICLSFRRLPHAQDIQFQEKFSRRVLFISSDMLYYSHFSLLIGGLFIIFGWLLGINLPGFMIISSIFVIWIIARMTFRLSRWLLKSPIGLSDKNSGLYWMIILFVLFVSVSGFILMLGQLKLVTPSLMDLFERLLMLLFLPLVYLSLRIRKLLIDKIYEQKGSGYWVKLIGLISLAIPMAIFTAAVVGIAGYINLSWAVAWHLSVFILVISAWLIVRGLVVELAQTAGNRLIKQSDQGIFWIKSIVEPIQLLIRLGLFLIAIWFIYRIFGGSPETGLNLKGWFKYTLFTLGDTPISGFDLLASSLLIALVFYLGRWSREITYGWLYSHVQDLGIRNSLSVFTQYTVVLVGLLIALNILGINLTSLAVFAGALGVGIGLGMQNIANNFVSGLILLAERPIRTKDWVSIGDKEGEVAEIGMRSVTVTTWDNQDVIIPNSDLTSGAFTNWTRSNNMVRTVLIIGIRYQDDPHEAQRVIEEAVIMQPEVALDPAPVVLLTEFAASSINFRVQYYLDVIEFSRLKIKSKIMFAIWDALKDAGIAIPFPQQDIYIKELPADGTHLCQATGQK